MDVVSRKVVAPHEVRELVQRLAEQSLEGMPATEARTLAGLSLETGVPLEKLQKTLVEIRGRKRRPKPYAVIAAVAVLGAAIGMWAYWPKPEPTAVVQSLAPPPVLAGPSPELDTRGLTTINTVTFGPDGTTEKIDPNFTPPFPVPDGISITAETNAIMWGAGDHRTLARQNPLKPDEVTTLKKDFVALLEYVRADAVRRGVKPVTPSPLPYPAFNVNLGCYMYSGVDMGIVNLPMPGADNDKFAGPAVNSAVDKVVDQLQRMLGDQATTRRNSGP